MKLLHDGTQRTTTTHTLFLILSLPFYEVSSMNHKANFFNWMSRLMKHLWEFITQSFICFIFAQSISFLILFTYDVKHQSSNLDCKLEAIIQHSNSKQLNKGESADWGSILNGRQKFKSVVSKLTKNSRGFCQFLPRRTGLVSVQV